MSNTYDNRSKIGTTQIIRRGQSHSFTKQSYKCALHIVSHTYSASEHIKL